ncbi:MAG: hypothetical protein AAGA48_26460 [Myxococcota bacterium]
MGPWIIALPWSGAYALPPANAALRTEAKTQIALRWPQSSPEPAPRLERALDGLVAHIAIGKIEFAEVSAELAQLFGTADVVDGEARTWAVALPPGHELDTSTVPVPDWARHLAVGTCRRLDPRRQTFYDLVLVVVAEEAR